MFDLDEKLQINDSFATDRELIVQVENLNFWYGAKQTLHDVDLDLRRGEVVAFVGPSGCGKTTLLKCLNRMQDDVRGAHHSGRILMARGTEMRDIYGKDVDPPDHRRRFGWVAQKPNPFPMSVFENVAYPARLHGLVTGGVGAMRDHVEAMLRRASLWEELKDRLHEPGTSLSGGQQQRLCIARALSLGPELLLMDEPCGSLDPVSTQRVEDLIADLGDSVGTVIITHNMGQARRVSQRVAFFHLGRLMELRPTEEFFTSPQTAQARKYISGRYG